MKSRGGIYEHYKSSILLNKLERRNEYPLTASIQSLSPPIY